MKDNQRFVTSYWRVVLLVARKDLRAEIRGRELISSMFLFAFLAVVIFSFALELDREARENSVAGVLWVTIIFSGMLGLARSMAVEKDKGSLDALLIAPVHRSALFYGKALANLLFTLVIALLLMVLLTVLFNISLFVWQVLVVLVLGCIGFTVSGTLVSSMSVYARARETLLPIMLLPVILPVLISAVRASGALLAGLKAEDWLPWMQLLALVDVVFLIITYFLFDYVVEE
ncbi:MAG: heme exporter protein CcmB [Anaerolineae bacterium]|nr:MAG: ABC transporter permease subunit [Anaerolineae bacterium]MCL4879389.1 heme exporter protein CcmB [Anaerolineae bacterium]